MNPKGSSFTENIVRLNCLSFRRWVFEHGMEFMSESKWWGDKGYRRERHNGLDMLFYEGSDGEVKTLCEGTRVPIIYPGRLVKLSRDFLAYSLFVSHEIFDRDRRLITLYGHVLQVPGVTEGEQLAEGTAIATLPPAEGGGVPGHLHISVAFIPVEVPVRELSWKMLAHTPGVHFVNPMEVI